MTSRVYDTRRAPTKKKKKKNALHRAHVERIISYNHSHHFFPYSFIHVSQHSIVLENFP